MRMRDTLARLAANRMPTLPSIATGRLDDFAMHGANPGALGAKVHVPSDLADGAPLVVVLHGCTQSAEGYDAGTGWSRLADRAGFAVLFPEQRRANNPNLCFNWFQKADIARHGGEAESIARMAGEMVARHALDPERVFVTGLSAGGAMAAVMLAAYPDMFAGGAIIGGLPYGCAVGVPAALERMAGRGGDARDSIDVAKRASGLAPRRWPTVSLWHGAADTIVTVTNMDDLAAQWRGVHGAEGVAPSTTTGANWSRSRWDIDGRSVVETWRISGMGHGVPLDPSAPDGLGAAGPYMLAVGVDSTTEIARSWGIAPPAAGSVRRSAPPAAAPRPIDSTRVQRPHVPEHSASGVQKVIEDALRAAGLMK